MRHSEIMAARWDHLDLANRRLFIPDDNVHVSAKLQLLGERQLKLTGCAVAGLFCRSQIWTRYGKGVYIFTAYSWFRQLPAGVPGAYRMFANLLSAK